MQTFSTRRFHSSMPGTCLNPVRTTGWPSTVPQADTASFRCKPSCSQSFSRSQSMDQPKCSCHTPCTPVPSLLKNKVLDARFFFCIASSQIFGHVLPLGFSPALASWSIYIGLVAIIYTYTYIYILFRFACSLAGIFIQAIWLLTLRCLGFFCEPHSASSFYVGLHRLLATLLIATTSLTVSVFEDQVN